MRLNDTIAAVSLAIKALWAKIWLRRPPQPAVTPAVETVAEQPAPDDEPKVNRHQRRQRNALRRKLERERLKHDEWVTPGGLEPIRYTRSPSVEHERPSQTSEKLYEFLDQPLIGDEWREGDGGPDVLFEQNEFFGTFNFRDTILKQLDLYWLYIERMKKYDSGAYEFYRRIGATLVPYAASGARNKFKRFHKYKGKDLEHYKHEIYLTPWFKEHWPTWGCVCHGIDPLHEEQENTELEGNLWTPKFLYFVGVENVPWHTQHVTRPGKYYLMTIYWDRPNHPKWRHRVHWGVPQTYPLWISADGETLSILKTRETSTGTIRPEHDWRIPYDYKQWAKQYGLTAQVHLSHLFCNAARMIEQTNYATCRVAVSKGELTAVFGIEPQRIPYFFKDRDVTLTHNGRKERIFHVVRPFVDSSGKAHPMQFRGLKEFEWAGCHVKITVPGRDHFVPLEFNVPMLNVHRRKHKGEMNEAEIAEWMLKKMNQGMR